MSTTSLGAVAICKKLIAGSIAVPYVSGGFGGPKTFADDGSTVVPRGFYVCNTSGGPTTLNLPSAQQDGDIVEFYYHTAGGNSLTVNATLHVVGLKAITFPSGAYLKLMWYISSWNIVGRDGTQVAATNAVDYLPVIPP